jgi:hypothetical protein
LIGVLYGPWGAVLGLPAFGQPWRPRAMLSSVSTTS